MLDINRLNSIYMIKINIYLIEMSATGLVYVEIAGAGLLGLDGGALDALRLQSLALPDNRLHRLPEKTFRYVTKY